MAKRQPQSRGSGSLRERAAFSEYCTLAFQMCQICVFLPLALSTMHAADLPRGPIKNNSMRKLAAKTLMEILPGELTSKVHARLEEQAANPDFVTLIGLVSFYCQ